MSLLAVYTFEMNAEELAVHLTLVMATSQGELAHPTQRIIRPLRNTPGIELHFLAVAKANGSGTLVGGILAGVLGGLVIMTVVRHIQQEVFLILTLRAYAKTRRAASSTSTAVSLRNDEDSVLPRQA